MKKPVKIAVKILVTAAVIFLYFWFVLPPLNLRSPSFWVFMLFCLAAVYAINFFTDLIALYKNFHRGSGNIINSFISRSGKITKGFLIAAAAIIVLLFVGGIIGSPLFHARSYQQLISVADGSFTEDVAEISMSQIPVVDRDSSMRLGKRKLGEMSDLVSQFEISDDYTQINYKGTPVRVTPLQYGDVIKWFNNQSDGVPAYITVDMVTQEASLIRLEEGIKYSPNEYFMRNLDRHLRFKYPTKIFDEISFEIDESGTPYWVAPTISYRIGLWSGRDINGAVLVNAVTGESQYHTLNEIPEWVDQVFVSDLVIEQLNYYGLYQSGFWNAYLGQKGVLATTEGYNYIAINDDVYLYTGMTSVVGDESNVGFVLVNMRTKETKFYTVPGAEEYSAMESAEGQVQHLNYHATFPLLLNISNRPTYFISLKDAAGLVKMYAFVDVERYQIVGTGSTISEARADYTLKLKDDNVSVSGGESETVTVSEVRSVVSGGSTIILFKDTAGNTYSADIGLSLELAFLQEGDTVVLTYVVQDDIRTVTEIKK